MTPTHWRSRENTRHTGGEEAEKVAEGNNTIKQAEEGTQKQKKQ